MTPFWIFDSSTKFILSSVEGLRTGFRFWIAISRRKKVFSFVIIAGLMTLYGSVEAQQPGTKIYRLGYLGGAAGIDDRELRLRQALRELGYLEGRNIIIEWRFANGDENRLTEMASELVRLKPDIIVTHATQPARVLKNATVTIPIVVGSAGDLVGRGIVASLAKPGGNITGFTSIAPELNGKRLEVLKDIVPNASRVAFLFHPSEQDEAKELKIAGRVLGLGVQQQEVNQTRQFESAYAAIQKERADALLISRNPFMNSHRSELIELAVKHRLPAMCDGTEWINAGCLLSYSLDRMEGSHRVAVLIDKILKGAKPVDLPVEQPTKFELVINLKTAKQIGLVIPPNVLARADRVIR